MKKLLVTGGSGLLGAAIVYELHSYFEVYATYHNNQITSKHANYINLDLTNKEEAERLIEKIKPDIIIHTAAMTDVDLCELKPEFAKKINVGATEYIVNACERQGIKLVHISTDYVFDGEKGNYKESDKMNPIDIYAKTKAEAEGIAKCIKAALIIRTSIYGWNLQKKMSFVEWVIASLRNKKVTNILTDQTTSMIFVNSLAKIIKQMLDKNLSGVYNVGSDKPLSKYKAALAAADVFSLDRSLIMPITSRDLLKSGVWKAKRPRNTSLDIVKIKRLIKMPFFHEDLGYMKEIEKRYKEQFNIG